MKTETILAIAAKHSAYADSQVCVRGQDDIVAFANEVLQLAAKPVLTDPGAKLAPYEQALARGVRTRTTIIAEDLRRHQDQGAPLKATVEINPEPIYAALKFITVERDEQCDGYCNIPSAVINEAASA